MLDLGGTLPLGHLEIVAYRASESLVFTRQASAERLTVENAPSSPRTPHHPGRRSDGVCKAACGTLPHPLENAPRFPQPPDHGGGLGERRMPGT
jgi:hypothetical protein